MKYLKLFEGIKIEKGEFPWNGHDLSPREEKILTDLVGVKYLIDFTIKVEDHYYYIEEGRFYFNRFDGFNELKEFILFTYFMYYNKPKEFLELLKTSKFDSSFGNGAFFWACKKGHTEIVNLLLNDPRVDPSAGEYRDQFNYSIKISYKRGHKKIVRLLLNDERVRSKLTDEEINKYTNAIS